MCVCKYVCMYVYTHSVCTYIYPYIYIWYIWYIDIYDICDIYKIYIMSYISEDIIVFMLHSRYSFGFNSVFTSSY